VKFEKGKALDRALSPIQPLSKKKAVIQVGPQGAASEPGDPPDRSEPRETGDPPIRG